MALQLNDPNSCYPPSRGDMARRVELRDCGSRRAQKEEEAGTKRINQERFDQINVARPQTLALVCPFCMPQMQDAVKSRSLEETMRLRDLAELIAESTGATGK